MNMHKNKVNWKVEFECLNIHHKWDLFKRKLEEFANQCIPVTEPKRYKAPWMNRKVVKSYKENTLPGRDIWNTGGVIDGGSMLETETLSVEQKEMKKEHMRKSQLKKWDSSNMLISN